MAAFVFSANPNTIFNPNAPNNDILIVDNTSASKLKVTQSGSNLVLTNGTNTATLQNFVREQVTTTNITFTDGSVLLIGDNNIAVADDGAANGLAGGVGNDQLIGLGGDDNLVGGAGNDLIYGNTGNDTIGDAAGGNDTAFGGQGNDTLNYTGTAATSSLLIYGNLGDDTINGGLGNDKLFGGQGNDRLFGQDGNDNIQGLLGLDSISGGARQRHAVGWQRGRHDRRRRRQ